MIHEDITNHNLKIIALEQYYLIKIECKSLDVSHIHNFKFSSSHTKQGTEKQQNEF